MGRKTYSLTVYREIDDEFKEWLWENDHVAWKKWVPCNTRRDGLSEYLGTRYQYRTAQLDLDEDLALLMKLTWGGEYFYIREGALLAF